jgi:uncharacterized protein
MDPGPVRTCVGCRCKRPKADLLRVVRGPDGVVRVDPKGRAPGRGAYVCLDPACVRVALSSGRLGRALRCEGPLGEGLETELKRAIDGRM